MLIIDRRSKNKDAVAKLTKRYRVKRVVVSAYHLQANVIIDRGHQPIVDTLLKLSDGGFNYWVCHLPAVLWADRLFIRISTNLTPYYIYCKSEPVFSIELEVLTWQIIP